MVDRKTSNVQRQTNRVKSLLNKTKMKNNILAIVFSFLAFQSLGQTQTLFDDANIYGGFGGPIVEFSGFKGDVLTSIGGGGGVFIDNFFLGGYGMGSLELEDAEVAQEDFRLNMGHGGFWLGYAHRPFQVVHFYGSTKVGWGDINVQYKGEGTRPSDNIFVVQPEVGVEVNMFRWFKIVGTVGYRSVSGVNRLDTHSNSDFSGITGGLTFRFGWFEN